MPDQFLEMLLSFLPTKVLVALLAIGAFALLLLVIKHAG